MNGTLMPDDVVRQIADIVREPDMNVCRLITDIIKNKGAQYIHCVTVQNQDDLWWAGALEVRSTINTCLLLKSGYVFESPRNAIVYAQTIRANLDTRGENT